MTVEPWTGPPLHLPSGQVLLDADSTRIVFVVLGHYVRSQAALNGSTALSAQLRAIDRVLRAAVESGKSANGHVDVRFEVDQSALTGPDLITMQEVAEMLDIGNRQARRLASEGRLGRVYGGTRGRLVSRAEVQAEVDARRAG